MNLFNKRDNIFLRNYRETVMKMQLMGFQKAFHKLLHYRLSGNTEAHGKQMAATVWIEN